MDTSGNLTYADGHYLDCLDSSRPRCCLQEQKRKTLGIKRCIVQNLSWWKRSEFQPDETLGDSK